MRCVIAGNLAAVLSLSNGALAQSRSTLDVIKQRGALVCGVSQGLAGFSSPDDKGQWKGFDVDFCRAVAAAIVGDPEKVSFKSLSTKERFTALQSGEIDVLSRTTTWTMTRDSSLGLSFIGTMYYDGQSFLLRKSLGIKAAKELKSASICTLAGSTSELNLADFFRRNQLDYKPVVFEKNDDAVAAYENGRCDAFSTDATQLQAERLRLKSPADHVVLGDLISKEPLAPVVRQGDSQFFTIVKWTYFLLLNAEEFGISAGNVDQMLTSTNPEIRRVLGREGDFGKGIGLDNDWSVRVIKAVGNYGEIFERNLGTGSPLKIERGFNRLWNAGGLMYAPPIR